MPILNAGWLQVGVSAVARHDQFVPPVPAPVLKDQWGLIEAPAFMGWPPGMLSHKTAPSVLSDGNPTVQHGHDIGYFIPHFAIPYNALCVLHTVFSKHKVVIPVSRVKVEKKEAGTYLWFLLGEICANPVSMASGVVYLLKCTVWTTITVGDLLKGIALIAVDRIFDKQWNKLSKKLPKLAPKHLEVLGGLDSLPEILKYGGGSLVWRYLLREGGNKFYQHILKSWVLSPMITGLPFKSGIGRGNWAYHKFF
jgi:hypothetical protein